MTPATDRARIGALLLAIVGSFAIAPSVSAHAEVVTATPAKGSTVTEAVSQVVVTYSEILDPDSRLAILDPSGNRIAVGIPDPADDHRMVATLDPALTSGTYTVRSTSISAEDGDLDRQQWTFTVSVPATPEPTPVCTDGCDGQSTTAPTASPTASPSAAASPAASPGPSSPASSGSDVVLPIIAALAIIAILAGILLSRGRRAGSA
jgi:copper resistance protein C